MVRVDPVQQIKYTVRMISDCLEKITAGTCKDLF